MFTHSLPITVTTFHLSGWTQNDTYLYFVMYYFSFFPNYLVYQSANVICDEHSCATFVYSPRVF